MSRPHVPLRRILPSVVLAAALAAATGARAQERPSTVPTRDVEVTYRMGQPPGAPPAAPLEQRMRWLVAEQLLRVDPPTRGLWILVDYKGRRMSMVQEENRRVLDMEGAASPIPAMPGTGQSFTRRAADAVAGTPCTEWQTADTGGQPTLACITVDGVLLRARQGNRTLIEAQRVQYAPQDATAFRIPGGYQRIQAPQPGQVPQPGAPGSPGRGTAR